MLPARLLLDVVRSLPGGDVSLELRPAEQDVELVAGTARSTCARCAPRTSRRCRSPAATRSSPARAAFVETIARVARSASRDETRPILTGILVSAAGDELRMVATDSYRLSVKETTLEAPLPDGFEANVPARALRGARPPRPRRRRATSASASAPTRSSSRSTALALSSRLIDGQFPNYRQLLPEAYEHELPIDRQELLEVVRRISLMAQKNAPLRLSLQRGRADDLGADAGRRRGERAAAGPVRRRTVRDRVQPGVPLATAWRAPAPENVVLKLISPLRPGLLESADGSGFLYLIMPIRLNV